MNAGIFVKGRSSDPEFRAPISGPRVQGSIPLGECATKIKLGQRSDAIRRAASF